jgi:N-acetylmuramoyl-L-alanine amidase
LAQILTDAGAIVIMTRVSDTTMSLKSRADIARENNAHILIWLHNNSIGSSSDPEFVKGASTYYTHAQGMPFAIYVYPELVDLGLKQFGRVHRTYYITRQTDFIVFLVEGAFMSNPEDEIFLMDEKNLKKLAQAVYDGMEQYLMKIAESAMSD